MCPFLLKRLISIKFFDRTYKSHGIGPLWRVHLLCVLKNVCRTLLITSKLELHCASKVTRCKQKPCCCILSLVLNMFNLYKKWKPIILMLCQFQMPLCWFWYNMIISILYFVVAWYSRSYFNHCWKLFSCYFNLYFVFNFYFVSLFSILFAVLFWYFSRDIYSV